MERIKNFFKRCTVLLLILSMLGGIVQTQTSSVSAADTKYWIKVNKQANVATVYQLKGGKYKAIKAFLISCGGSNTPSGTYYTPAKYRWHTLQGPSYGQYCTRISGGVLFHSVWYYSHSKASQSTKEFNKLGKTASHGCVRMTVADAKWIYDNCPVGTKVTIYSSSNPGPLGKPKGIKVSTSRKMYWDPTDPDPKNPYSKKPTITISKKKAKTVQYGAKYNLKSGVTAKDPVTKKSYTSRIKYTVKKYSKKKYVTAKFNTKKLGTYKITYTVTSDNKKKASKTFTIRVRDTKAPVISNAISYYARYNGTNAVNKTTAKLASGRNLTSKMYVYITAPGASKATRYTYAKAKTYKFTKVGDYKVKYYVTNPYNTKATASKTVTIVCKKDAVITVDQKKIDAIKVSTSSKKDQVIAEVRKAISIDDNGTKVNTANAKITLDQDTFTAGKDVIATISYQGINGYTTKATVTLPCYQDAKITVNDTNLALNAGVSKADLIVAVKNEVKVTDNGDAVSVDQVNISLDPEKDTYDDYNQVVHAMISYTGKSGNKVEEVINVSIQPNI